MSIDRRTFLSTSGTAILSQATPSQLFAAPVGTKAWVQIPDDGWRLWPDTSAQWQDDEIYLPDELNLATLPATAPSGGWNALTPSQGIPVVLPASVEQFHWGRLQSRPYTYQEYEHAAYDDQVANGAYRGVSWFWRKVKVDKLAPGKRATLRVRGFRQRMEVFVNRKLVGYDIIAETAYECDITSALKSGDNLVAIRITNPGGVYDWRDFEKVTWGKKQFHAGRGFGGLDRGLSIHLHDRLLIQDAWVLNTPDPRTITAFVEVINQNPGAMNYSLRLNAKEANGPGVVGSAETKAKIEGGQTAVVPITLTCQSAALWSPENPNLHKLGITLEADGASDERELTFGLRWFAPEDIGSKAVFRLNGERVRIYSAIEFGYWGFNGLWPTPDLARKSVSGAKQMGLNGLIYHRNLGKTESFECDDRLGLLRHMECGGGLFCYQDDKTGTNEATNAPPTQPPIDTSGKLKAGERAWSERYMEQRLLRMIRDHRSHPSLIVYHLQNESVPDLHNPKIFHTLRAMRALDPSRAIVLHSGIEPRNQAFFLPYDDKVYVEDGTGYSGWSDTHTIGGSGVWQDKLYTNPRYFAHYDNNAKEISVQGEMLGWGAPDNHALTLASIKSGGGYSYNKDLHVKALESYETFLSKWDFNGVFPNASVMLTDVGNKLYETWVRVLHIARTCDTTDHLVINGWEDQPIDSHSGFVDNHRNFKGDPALIRAALEPAKPVVQPRVTVERPGKEIMLDLFWINETRRTIPGHLNLSLVQPSGSASLIKRFGMPELAKDVFAVPIAEGLKSPILSKEGYFDFVLESDKDKNVAGSTRVFIVDPAPSLSRIASVGLVGDLNTFRQFTPHSELHVESFRENVPYDAIVATGFQTDRGIPLSGVLRALRGGVPLFVLAQSASDAHRWAKILSGMGAFKYNGAVGDNRGCWMGNWTFAKKHPSYDGLPTNQVMKWEYQLAHDDASGLMIDGPGVEIIAGYGRDHDHNLGAATFSASLGKGEILFQCIRKMQPLIYERFVNNGLNYLVSLKKDR